MNWLKPIPNATAEEILNYPDSSEYMGWFEFVAGKSNVDTDTFHSKVQPYISANIDIDTTSELQLAYIRYNVGVHLKLIPGRPIQYKRRHHATTFIYSSRTS